MLFRFVQKHPTKLPVPKMIFHAIVRKEVCDGFSHTYQFGEKYLMPDCYETGIDGGHNESMYIGDNADIARFIGNGAAEP